MTEYGRILRQILSRFVKSIIHLYSFLSKSRDYSREIEIKSEQI